MVSRWCPWVHPFVHPSDVRPTVRIFVSGDNLSICQWIFTKLGMSIDIVEIWFGIANGQNKSFLWSYLPATRQYFRFRTITGVNINEFSPNLHPPPLPRNIFTDRSKAVLLLWFTISVIVCLCMYVLVIFLFWPFSCFFFFFFF